MARKAVSDEFKIFSERLSQLMREKGLKQKNLADELGVKRQTVSLYMTGQSMPDAEQLKNIAVFFDVSADWLLGISNTKSIDIDTKMICKYTGLSEECVNFFRRLEEGKNEEQLFIFNALIEDEIIQNILKAIEEIRLLQKAVSGNEYAEDFPEEENETIKKAHEVLENGGMQNCKIVDIFTLLCYKECYLERLFSSSMDMSLYYDGGILNAMPKKLKSQYLAKEVSSEISNFLK